MRIPLCSYRTRKDRTHTLTRGYNVKHTRTHTRWRVTCQLRTLSLFIPKKERSCQLWVLPLFTPIKERSHKHTNTHTHTHTQTPTLEHKHTKRKVPLHCDYCLENSKTSDFLYTFHISFDVSERSCAGAEEPESSLKTQNRLLSCTPASNVSTWQEISPTHTHTNTNTNT